MLIEDTEALRNWLIVVLEPLCDADSSALARYVLALLKKDKHEKELKKVMVEQLDVFLSEQTKPFVERLFEAINTEEYLKTTKDEEGRSQHTISSEISKSKTVIKSENQEEAKPRNAETHNEATASDLYEGKVKGSSKATETKHFETDTVVDTAIISSTVKFDTESMPAERDLSVKERSASPQFPRATADKENQPRDVRRRFNPQRSRSRSWSRERSADRSARRSRSKDRRNTDREKNSRQFKTKSPNNETRQANVYERRRSGGGDRRRNALNNDDRSSKFGNSNDSARKGNPRHRSQSRSRSPSGERGSNLPKTSNKDASPAKVIRSPLDQQHIVPNADGTEIRQRCRDFDEKGYCVRGETCPWDHGVNPVVFEGVNNPSLLTMSLREYNPDAPDLWSRSGPTLPLNSAVPNPLVVGTPSINPFSGTIRPGAGNAIMAGIGGSNANPNLPLSAADYTRGTVGAPFRPGGGGSMLSFSYNSNNMPAPIQRELIPIPVIDVNTNNGNGSAPELPPSHPKRRFDNIDESLSNMDAPTKRKIPLNSRLGPRLATVQGNCSLELRKVPRGLNTIAHLNNHFAKFGKIVNIQISYDGDPEAAIVTFSNHAEANVAYRSTEAVLNNRFIKVFWHNQDINAPGEVPVSGPVSSSIRKSQYHINNVAVNQNAVTTATTTTTLTPSESANSTTKLVKATDANVTASDSMTVSTSAPAEKNVATGNTTYIAQNASRHKIATPRLPNSTVLRKKQEQAKAVVQLANGLRKRKQELLQSYLKQMKSALELIEKVDPTDPQRAKTLETIKSLQESIDKLRKDIAAEQENMQSKIQSQLAAAAATATATATATTTTPVKKSKEQAKKELLDIELELFAQQQEGNDTTAIQKRLEELQRSLGIGPTTSPLATGNKTLVLPSKSLNFIRGGIRGRFADVSTRVDRRPKSIIVTGFVNEETDLLLEHLKTFGEVVKHEIDDTIPQLTIHYSNRLNAEQAMARGKVFKDKVLQMLWLNLSTFSLNLTTPCKSPTYQAASSTEADSETACTELEKSLLKDGEVVNIDTLPELPLEDEEEDDENEDRFWRR